MATRPRRIWQPGVCININNYQLYRDDEDDDHDRAKWEDATHILHSVGGKVIVVRTNKLIVLRCYQLHVSCKEELRIRDHGRLHHDDEMPLP